MRPLYTEELIKIWENNWSKTDLEKSLQLIATACSVSDLNLIAQLSLGERDARLLQLRKWMFGNHLINLADCPKCGDSVEWEMTIDDLCLQKIESTVAPKFFEFQKESFHIQYRLLNSNDVLKLMIRNPEQFNSRDLICSCILEAKASQSIYQKESLPESVFEALEKNMQEKDPQANISISLNCPTCQNQWNAPFMILNYLWIEIDNWVKHILQDVYVLARAFGWSENSILSMNPRRRQIYLQMLRS